MSGFTSFTKKVSNYMKVKKKRNSLGSKKNCDIIIFSYTIYLCIALFYQQKKSYECSLTTICGTKYFHWWLEENNTGRDCRYGYNYDDFYGYKSKWYYFIKHFKEVYIDILWVHLFAGAGAVFYLPLVYNSPRETI